MLKKLLLALVATTPLWAQTTVFNDDFSTSAGTTFTTANGPIGSSSWTHSRSGSDFGARINGGNLTLTNDSGGSANLSGWTMATVNTTGFASPYSSILANSPGIVTWTFNMRQIRTNPRGFSLGNYGVAFILAGSSGTSNAAGTGYAVVLGNSGSTDPVRLVRYSAGVRTHTTMISSNTPGLTDFGNEYLSFKVTYAPTTNTWSLFVRNDMTAFADPNSGTLAFQGSLVNNTYTASSLPVLAAYWNGGISTAQTAIFDNVRVTVTGPAITSLSPSSRVANSGAFTLTVNGTNFISGLSVVRWNGSNRTTTYVSPTQLTASIPATDLAVSGTAAITVANGAAISNWATFIIDPAGAPVLTVSAASLSPMTTVTGTASASQSYTISGANLTADAVITAPANFELSTNNTTFSTSLNLPRSGNVLTGQPVTIYARVRATAPAGIYQENVTNASTGAGNKLVAVSATVLAAQPTTQPSGISFSGVTSTSFTINLTPGNGSSRIILLRSGGAVNAAPTDGVTYWGVPAFGLGSEIGTGNLVVYAGTSNSITVTGLTPATTYHAAAYEYNGAGGTENYLTTTPAVGNRTTLNAPLGWQIYSANTNNIINFDATVDGVNANSFQGEGMSPTAGTGELNSNAWAVTGFSDGNIAFGGTSDEDEDYDRGMSETGEAIGGMYAFETSPNNMSLGIQPATGDFTPGTLTLRFQNQTGAPITSISIGYKVYVYNAEAASSSFNFSHSADNSTYNAVTALNVISPAAADQTPEWKASYRVVTITGLNIASNAYYYLRWNSATVSGSGAFDSFGLDDLSLVANPSTNFASFAGAADNFVVNGNSMLSGDVSVANDLTLNAGKLDINGRTLSLSGNVINNVTGGIKGGVTSNLSVLGTTNRSLSLDQTTPGTTNLLNNFSVATTATNTVTLLTPMVVNGTLAIAGSQAVDMGSNALSGTLSTISNSGTLSTQNATATPIPSGKNWGTTGTVRYNATSANQTVVTGTYNNLTLSSTGGSTAAGSFTVNGILNLPSNNPSPTVGSLSMGTHTLTMGGNATNTGNGDVTGIITRNSITNNVVYTLGHEHTSIIFPIAGTLPSAMSLKVAIGAAPAWRPGAIQRTYDFIQTGGSDTKAVIKAHYLDSELNGNLETKLVDWAHIVATSTTLEQGRSNFNTTENWVELSNVNIGLYFTSTFDQVRLTLDESAATSLTWNGSASTSWTTAANWTPNATPSDQTIVYIPDAATTLNDPTLNPSVLLGYLNIEPGGILNSAPNSQFTINGSNGAWINNGTFNPGNSTVIFTNADATIAGSTNFNNLTINPGAGLRPITGNSMTIAGNLVNNGSLYTGAISNTVIYSGTNQTIAQQNAPLSAYYNLIVNGTGAIFPASQQVNGDLTFNQPVALTGKTIVLAGNEVQTIGGSATATFGNLTLNTPTPVNLATTATVDGTLTLTSGRLDIGNFNLTLGSAPVSGNFGPSTMIATSGSGEVRRIFTGNGSYVYPIGDVTGTAEYSPVTVSVSGSGYSSAYVGVSVVDAIHPDNYSANNNISRYWNVTQSGISGATATVTGTYLPGDLTGPQSEISAAQLNGTFNQQTNPWIRFGALSANTLTATGATLTAGQPSYFTGIKGAPFSTLITGYGTFCQDAAVTLLAQSTGGDTPYTYLWSSGLGTQQTASPPTSTVGSISYNVTVKDANGLTVTDMATVTVLPPTVGGSVSASQNICTGTTPANLTLSGHTGSVLYWESATDSGFTTPQVIANPSATLSGAAIGPLTASTWFRAVVQNGSCAEVRSGAAAIIIRSTTWDGNAWSNGAPDSATTVIFSGNYTATADLAACSITVTNNAVVGIPSGFDVTISGALTVSSGTFTLENNANLLQTSNVANSGNITVKRNSSALKRLDYTLWSSPVSGQNLFDFSPLTVVSPTSRFYTYTTATNLYTSISSPQTVDFVTGQGYLIRTPNNHPTTATIWPGQFTGVPNNGTVSVTLTDNGPGTRFNLVGNPYPSPIDAVAFVTQNSSITGTLYFWRKTNNAASPSYCTWTSGGGFVDNGEDQVFDPNGVIRQGQGFFVEGNGTGTNLIFNNSQRIGNNANQFFRMDEPERHRIWLNLTGSAGEFSQMLVGYIDGATDGVDTNIDGRYFNDGPVKISTQIDGEDFAIQGLALPFDPADVIPLHIKVTNAGTHSIAIDHVDGLFSEGQAIYIRDNTSGLEHELSVGPFTFTSEAGTFADRFDLLFETGLSTDNPALANVLTVYTSGEDIVFHSSVETMGEIRLFDMRGRQVAVYQAGNASEIRLKAPAANQVWIAKIGFANGATATRKVIK